MHDLLFILFTALTLCPLAFFWCCCAQTCKLSTITTVSLITQLDGTWTNQGGGGVETSDAFAAARFNKRHPDGDDASLTICVTNVKATEYGDCLRFCPKMVDADNYLAVELAMGDATNCGEIRFLYRTAGADTTLSTKQVRWLVKYPGFVVEDRTYNVRVHYDLTGATARFICRVAVHTGGTTTEEVTAYQDFSHLATNQSGVATGTLTGTASWSAIGFERYPPLPEDSDNCSCPASCVIQRDPLVSDSREADSLCEWAVVSGSWSINGTDARCTGPGVGLMLSHYENWTDNDAVYAQVTMTTGTDQVSGNRWGVVVDAVDSSNYHLVRYTPDDTLNYYGYYERTLEIVKVTGGAETVLATLIRNTLAGSPIKVCVREGHIAAFMEGTGAAYHTLSVDTTLHGGKRAGLWCDLDSGTDDAVFKDWVYQLATECGAEADLERQCSPCNICEAYGGNFPHSWKIVLAGIVNGDGSMGTPATLCANANGTWIVDGTSDYTKVEGGNCGVTYLSDTVNIDVGSVDFGFVVRVISDTVIRVTVDSIGEWEYTFDAEECDLGTLTDVAMTRTVTLTSYCDNSAATCVLTALPT